MTDLPFVEPPFVLGRIAADMDIDPDQNPYELNTRDHLEWSQGWASRHQELLDYDA